MMRPSFYSQYKSRLITLSLFLLLNAAAAHAQTTSFTYQGRLQDGGTNANGSYDFQFTVWDLSSGGTQQPQPTPVTVSKTCVAVANGVFTVQLDFGATAFPGASRFLEIGARLTGAGSFTTLSPRQQITSTPYAIRSLNASSADAVTVNGVPGGSGNYVQNTTTPQATANFNISGNGTAAGTLSGNVVNTTTQYNIGGVSFASATGVNNTFVGVSAGLANTTGGTNAFFGSGSGLRNTTGSSNAFFGASAGLSNTEGDLNCFFGRIAGDNNTTGSSNVFVGNFAGVFNTTGSYNTAIGELASVGSNNLTNATAIGAFAEVDQSNALVLGSVNGFNGATASVNVGIGTTTPQNTLHVKGGTLKPPVAAATFNSARPIRKQG